MIPSALQNISPANGSRRVVITGIGVISAAGHTPETLWRSLHDGRSGAGPLTRFDPKDSAARVAAEVKDFDAADRLGAKLARRLDRSLQFALAAAAGALSDSGLRLEQIDPDRIGTVEGTSLSNNPAAHQTEDGFARRGIRGVSSRAMINGYCGGGSGEIAGELGLRGPSFTCSTGSASGNDAIGMALALIRADEADAMVAGGAEAPLLPSVWGGFSLHHILACGNSDPAAAMRPFDRTRDGFVLGEGAAFLALESLESALGRGARIYAEILGHGRATEAYDPVAPQPDGDGLVRAMEIALRKARLAPEDIDYINCHGTATAVNDPVEARAIRRVFNGTSARVGVSSTKPVTGHLMAASGAIEAAATALAIHHAAMPHTLNLRDPDAGCALGHVIGQARPFPIRHALNLSIGFGGRNACMVLGRPPAT